MIIVAYHYYMEYTAFLDAHMALTVGTHLLVVYFLHGLEVEAIVVEDDYVLRVQVRLERLALQDRLELLEQVERVLGARDVLKACVDEALPNARTSCLSDCDQSRG